MNLPEPIQTFVEPLAALQRLLGRFSEQGVIICGGVGNTRFMDRY